MLNRRGVVIFPEEFNRDWENRNLAELLAFFGTEDAQVLDYWLDNSLFSGWKKPPKPLRFHRETAEADIRYYRRLGIDSITTFACYLGEEYTVLYSEPKDIEEYGRILRG